MHYDSTYVHWDSRKKNGCQGLWAGALDAILYVSRITVWGDGKSSGAGWGVMVVSNLESLKSPNHLMDISAFCVVNFISMFRIFGIMLPFYISATICLGSPISILHHAHLLSFTLSSRRRDWWYIWVWHWEFTPRLLVSYHILFSGYELNMGWGTSPSLRLRIQKSFVC